MSKKAILGELEAQVNSDRARLVARYFKTGPGEYAAGDRFWGIPVPIVRKIAKTYRELSLNDFTELLGSPIHEVRQVSLFILVDQFQRAKAPDQKKQIYDLYLASTKAINNWDLVDTSAPQIVGGYLLERDRKILLKLAQSSNLWERRIALLATRWFIKNNDYQMTIDLVTMLLGDRHDLIHKAAGWMLREVGQRSSATLRAFLDDYASTMPRTMLRYAIEKLPEAERRLYLDLKKNTRSK